MTCVLRIAHFINLIYIIKSIEKAWYFGSLKLVRADKHRLEKGVVANLSPNPNVTDMTFNI